MSSRDFRQEQRSVAVAMAAALVATIVVLGGVMLMSRTPTPTPFAARLQFALRADIVVITWLAAAIANVARRRFFSERDIAGSSAGAASDGVRTAGAILQNMVEQVGLAVVTYLIVAATFVRSDAMITALAALFVVGRALFWAGYRHGARGRAFGFALTFYPSVLALLASAITIASGSAG